MKHSINQPRTISYQHGAFIKRKIKGTRRSKNLRISCEQNKNRNIPILVEERWDALRGIPKLRCLSLLEYLLGVPWASPSLSSCLSSFSSYRDLLDLRTLHPHKTQQKAR